MPRGPPRPPRRPARARAGRGHAAAPTCRSPGGSTPGPATTEPCGVAPSLATLRVVVAHASPSSRRPHDELRLADHVLHRHGATDSAAALETRVARVVAIVPQHEQVPLRHRELFERLLLG